MMAQGASVPRAETSAQLGAADLKTGDIIARREVRLTEEAFASFAQLSGDAHPIHYDAQYAAAQGLRAPIAHGLLVLGLTALGATELSKALHDSMIAMVGVEARYLAPIYVNDEVNIVFTVGKIEPKSQNRALVSFDIDVLSVPGATVCAKVTHKYMLKHSLSGVFE